MPEILDLRTVQDNTEYNNVIVYMSSCRKLPRKDPNKFYLAGTFTNKDSVLSFKIWEDNLVNALSQNSMEGRVIRISGKTKTYNNVMDISVTALQPVDDPNYPISLFLKSADVNSLFEEFKTFVSTDLSDNASKLLAFIFSNEKLYDRFKQEFAGQKMHDAQVGGLLNHTLKMLRIAKVVYSNEPRMANLPNYKDLLYLSIILHDVGKVWEMNMGVYQRNSYVTHRILGIEMLVKYKNVFVQLFDEDFYYQVISVLQGHHGEFGDQPNTVAALIVHMIDMLDSQTTGIFDKIENGETELKAGQVAVRFDSRTLTV